MQPWLRVAAGRTSAVAWLTLARATQIMYAQHSTAQPRTGKQRARSWCVALSLEVVVVTLYWGPAAALPQLFLFLHYPALLYSTDYLPTVFNVLASTIIHRRIAVVVLLPLLC